MSHSPRLICSQASWIAISEDEHIVSIGMLGPCKSRRYDILLATELNSTLGNASKNTRILTK